MQYFPPTMILKALLIAAVAFLVSVTSFWLSPVTHNKYGVQFMDRGQLLHCRDRVVSMTMTASNNKGKASISDADLHRISQILNARMPSIDRRELNECIRIFESLGDDFPRLPELWDNLLNFLIRRNLTDYAVYVYDRMLTSNIQTLPAQVSNLLSMFISPNDFEKSLQILEKTISKNVKVNYQVFSPVLRLMNSRLTKISQNALNDMIVIIEGLDENFSKREMLWDNLLGSLIRRRLVDSALYTYRRLLASGVDKSQGQLTNLLELFRNSSEFDRAMEILELGIQHSVPMSYGTFTPVFKICGNVDNVRKVLERMKISNTYPHVTAVSHAMRSLDLSSGDDCGQVYEMFDIMRSSGLYPNEMTYSCAMTVAATARNGPLGFNLLQEMIITGIEPNIVCYSGALTACSRAGMWKEVDFLLNDMLARGLPITESIFVGISAACKFTSAKDATVDKAAVAKRMIDSEVEDKERSMIESVQAESVGDINCLDEPVAIGSPEPDLQRRSILPDTSMPFQSAKVSKDIQWRKALSLLEQWAPRVEKLTESAFTIIMDVCMTAGRYREVLDVYDMVPLYNLSHGNSSFRFGFQASYHLDDEQSALKVVQAALRTGTVKEYMFPYLFELLDKKRTYDLGVGLLRRMGNHPSMKSYGKAFLNKALMDHYMQYRLHGGQELACVNNATHAYAEAQQLTDSAIRVAPNFDKYCDDLTAAIQLYVCENGVEIDGSSYLLALNLMFEREEYRTVEALLKQMIKTVGNAETLPTQYMQALQMTLKNCTYDVRPLERGIDIIIEAVDTMVRVGQVKFGRSLVKAVTRSLYSTYFANKDMTIEDFEKLEARTTRRGLGTQSKDGDDAEVEASKRYEPPPMKAKKKANSSKYRKDKGSDEVKPKNKQQQLLEKRQGIARLLVRLLNELQLRSQLSFNSEDYIVIMNACSKSELVSAIPMVYRAYIIDGHYLDAANSVVMKLLVEKNLSKDRMLELEDDAIVKRRMMLNDGKLTADRKEK